MPCHVMFCVQCLYVCNCVCVMLCNLRTCHVTYVHFYIYIYIYHTYIYIYIYHTYIYIYMIRYAHTLNQYIIYLNMGLHFLGSLNGTSCHPSQRLSRSNDFDLSTSSPSKTKPGIFKPIYG